MIAHFWLALRVVSVVFSDAIKVASLFTANSWLRVIFEVASMTMVVANCLRESETVSLTRVVMSTVAVGSLVGRIK